MFWLFVVSKLLYGSFEKSEARNITPSIGALIIRTRAKRVFNVWRLPYEARHTSRRRASYEFRCEFPKSGAPNQGYPSYKEPNMSKLGDFNSKQRAQAQLGHDWGTESLWHLLKKQSPQLSQLLSCC